MRSVDLAAGIRAEKAGRLPCRCEFCGPEVACCMCEAESRVVQEANGARFVVEAAIRCEADACHECGEPCLPGDAFCDSCHERMLERRLTAQQLEQLWTDGGRAARECELDVTPGA